MSRSGIACFVVATLSSVVVAALAGPGPAVAAPAPPPSPSADPFYSWSAPLAGAAPGTVLRTRPVAFSQAGVTAPISATQVLYRTTADDGSPSTTVTTVLRPPTPGPTRILSYHTAYDGLGSACDPSYTLRGYAPTRVATAEQAVIAGWLAAGYTVVVPDYEGQDLRWTVGRESGYAALDGIRAAQRFLRVPTSTPTGLIGYSGGSVPTQWGAELAPRYAPELRIVGAAAGGLPVDPAHNLSYVSGSPQWSGVIPALAVAYQRAYGLDLRSFLSARGLAATSSIQDQCIGTFAGAFGRLTDADMVRPPYRSLLDVAAVREAVARNTMGTAGTPRAPLLLAVGQSDARGDTVMITADVAGLARTYCGRGARVVYERYAGADHTAAFPRFEASAFRYLTDRYSGSPARSTC
ncbi:lipase family protein [Williamsia serinedens]|uniref:Secretory lipase n=1 Tax=Williamsia serinedens TaxID=391736 RepID=A0ABT1H294_9NOCA|nr:lipase family protein [Williamsia serinedens]MCP2161359.1 Secretory lipase [Williamsia serinedens]